MNLSRIIEITGQRLRLGKVYTERLSNAQVKQVLETAVQVMEEALIEEGRIEIQNAFVIEIEEIHLQQRKPIYLPNAEGKKRSFPAPDKRLRWSIRPSKALRTAVREIRRKT